MNCVSAEDQKLIQDHREIWKKRPELRSVYEDWFRELLSAAGQQLPVVEIGSGPGFFKEFFPDAISTDVIPNSWIDVVCDGCSLPFASKSVGALILLDVLHHVPRPLQFMKEAERVLKPGGRLVMIEPWITPFSYVLYRYFHHEDCSLSIDIELPFGSGKEAYSGNAAIPFKTLRYLEKNNRELRSITMKRFIGLPYLATLGFQRANSIPWSILRFARFMERFSRPLNLLAATRLLAVWEKKEI